MIGRARASEAPGAAMLVACGYFNGRLGDCNLYGFNVGSVPAYGSMPWFRIDLPRVLGWLTREHERGRPAPLSAPRRRCPVALAQTAPSAYRESSRQHSSRLFAIAALQLYGGGKKAGEIVDDIVDERAVCVALRPIEIVAHPGRRHAEFGGRGEIAGNVLDH